MWAVIQGGGRLELTNGPLIVMNSVCLALTNGTVNIVNGVLSVRDQGSMALPEDSTLMITNNTLFVGSSGSLHAQDSTISIGGTLVPFR